MRLLTDLVGTRVPLGSTQKMPAWTLIRQYICSFFRDFPFVNVVSSCFVGVSSFEFLITHPSQIVFNPRTYPNFLRFLQLHPPQGDEISELPPWPLSMFFSSPPLSIKAPGKGIRILPTQMAFTVSQDNGAFEWAGKNLLTVFCQPWRIFDPSMGRMLYDVFRFNACSLQLLKRPTKRSLSIGRYLSEEGYSNAFKDNYLIVCYLNDSSDLVLTTAIAYDCCNLEHSAHPMFR